MKNSANNLTLTKSHISKRSLKGLTKELSLDEILVLQANLSEIALEREAQETEKKRKEDEQQAKIIAFVEKVKKDGLSIEDVLAALSTQTAETVTSTKKKQQRKYKKRPAMYQYVDQSGITKTWTGQGRTPLVIQKELNEGKTLQDFLIAA